MKKLISLLLLSTIAIGYTNCKKKDKDDNGDLPPEELVKPDFDIVGEKFMNAPISFLSKNVSSTTRIDWNFGDGSQATGLGSTVNHKYRQPGSYVIIMSIDGGRQGSVEKGINITLGTKRLGGMQKWNMLLKRYKYKYPLDHIPTQGYSQQFEVSISADDSTITIPTVQNMRYPGPYKVKLASVDEKSMTFENADKSVQMSFDIDNSRGGIRMVQSSKDTTWEMDGFADIFR